MIIDRSKFLTLAASIATASAAVACGGSGAADDGADNTSGALVHNNDPAAAQCFWDPAKEGTTRETQQFFAGDIGFDPVNNFSAAEGFCFRATGLDHASDSEFMSVQQVYLKCSSYAKLYVPQRVYWAFQKMARDGRVSWDSLYAIDHEIDRETGFCATDGAKRACASAPDKEECIRVATQLKPEKVASMTQCMTHSTLSPADKLFSCVEGGFDTFR